MAALNMTPVKFKLVDQGSPRRSERKRSLFPSNSPQAKDGMSGVSPLNSSSDVYSPPLPSPSWSITPTKEDPKENHLSPRSKIKFDKFLKKKGQLEFHSLSPEPLLTKSPRKSRKALSERNFFEVFEKLPDSPEKQDQNILPSASKYEVVRDNYNKIDEHLLQTPEKSKNTHFLKRRSPKGSSEKKLEIKPRTFYGNIAPILATNQTNCLNGVKRVFGPPLMISKARTKLFNDKNEGGSKKRTRSTSSESIRSSKRRKEMYPGVRHAIKRSKPKYEHVALVKSDSIRDKIKKSFDFSHTPYAMKKKRSDGWDYPAKFTKPERIEDDNQNRKFFKSTVPRPSPSSVIRNGSLLTPPPTIKKRKLLDPSCEYFEDSQSQEAKKKLNVINPSDILDMIEDGLVQDVESIEEQKGVSEILLHLAEDEEEEEEDSLDRTRRELVELFDEDSCDEFREKSTKSSPGESVSRLADSTAILAINENARDFIPSFVQKKDTKENLDSPQRFFPIFSNISTISPTLTDVTNKKVLKEKNHWRLLGENQMQIDAGQRQFGATQCSECGLVYQLGEPDDEIQHNLYHSNFQTLRHTGWKNENVVGYFGNNDRIIMVTPTDLKSWQTKAENVLQIVDKDLGFTSDRPLSAINFKAFLYVSEKTIVGCLVAIPLAEAYKMYVSETDVDICSKETYPVKCGISRIWTHTLSRRQGIATKLVDTLRRNFMYGRILTKEDIAYSVPSPDGKQFAQKYMGKTDYYVYCNF